MSLKTGFAVGKPSPTKTTCFVPFVVTTAAFGGGTTTLNGTVPVAADVVCVGVAEALFVGCFLRVQTSASALLLTTREQFEASVGFGLGAAGFGAAGVVDDDGEAAATS